MQLPIPPSDSLYKFLCIASILGAISLVIWTDKQVTDLEHRQGDQRRRVFIAEAELKNIESDTDYLSEQIAQTKDMEGGTRSIEARDKVRARLRAERLKSAELAADKMEMDRLAKTIRVKLRIGFLQIALFFFTFAANLIAWYRKVQYHQDRMLLAQAETAELALKTARAEHQASGAARSGGAL